jgi:hypothetical protein
MYCFLDRGGAALDTDVCFAFANLPRTQQTQSLPGPIDRSTCTANRSGVARPVTFFQSDLGKHEFIHAG